MHIKEYKTLNNVQTAEYKVTNNFNVNQQT